MYSHMAESLTPTGEIPARLAWVNYAFYKRVDGEADLSLQFAGTARRP